MKKLCALFAISCYFFTNASFASPDKPEAGFDYVLVKNKNISSSNISINKNKIEVTEFFSFTCGHCYALHPQLSKWEQANKNKAYITKIHVDFGGIYAKYQKLYYTLEIINKLDLFDAVFNSFHKAGKTIQTDSDLLDFAKLNKLDGKQLLSIYHSFSVATKAKQANKMLMDYGIDAVPTIVVAGKYITSSQMVGGREEVLKVVSYLVNKELSTNNKVATIRKK